MFTLKVNIFNEFMQFSLNFLKSILVQQKRGNVLLKILVKLQLAIFLKLLKNAQ